MNLALSSLISLLLVPAVAASGALSGSMNLPAVGELHEILRQQIPDLPPPPSGETNSEAYLESLAPLVLIGNDSEPSGPPLTKTNVYDPGIGYLRINYIEPRTSPALAGALLGLAEANKLDGLVVDLRFAAGRDYRSAADAAGLFSSIREDSMKVGDQPLPIEPKAAAPPLPIMLLVNTRTRGAAEAFAAGVRAIASPSLLLGTNTAGQARLYREMILPGGSTVRISTDSLSLPKNGELPVTGLKPDLVVGVSPEDEILYFANEFQRVVQGQPVTNNPTFRLNEAELVRRRRGGRPVAIPSEASASPSVQDPVLARGIDLLTGLAALAAAKVDGNSR